MTGPLAERCQFVTISNQVVRVYLQSGSAFATPGTGLWYIRHQQLGVESSDETSGAVYQQHEW